MNTYVIHCKGGDEEHVLQLLSETVLREDEELYIPRKKLIKHYKGAWTEKVDILFPGYIFLTTSDLVGFRTLMFQPKFKTYYKMVGKDGEDVIPIRDEELAWIRKLTGEEHVLEPSIGFKEGSSVRFVSGPMVGFEGKILSINRHKRYAIIEMPFMGEMRSIQIGIEVLDSLEEAEEKANNRIPCQQ